MATMLVPAARACPVPVFRYGLERWPADSYELIVFGGSDEVAPDLPAAANVRVKQVDLGRPLSRRMQRLWDRQAPTGAPWMVLGYPVDGAIAAVAWVGPADAETVEAVCQSPARAEIARRIGEGHSAVWVLLTCGDAEADDQAAVVLETELAKLQQTLRLPDPVQGNWYEGEPAEWPDDLRIELSILRVRRDDPAERVLVSMLLHSEPDLADLAEPMAFPVFARGRALPALVGRGIEPRNIRDACEYLTGACSCEVKRLNPGVDLLIAADWDAMVTRRLVDELDMGTLVGAMTPAPVATAAPVTPPATPAPIPTTDWWVLAIAVAALGGISGVMYLVLRRSAGRP